MNPIARQLIRRDRVPSLAQTIVLAVAVASACLVAWRAYQSLHPLESGYWLTWTGVIGFGLLPLVFAACSLRYLSQFGRMQPDLSRSDNSPRLSSLRGYVIAALWQFRIWLAVAVGLFPILILPSMGAYATWGYSAWIAKELAITIFYGVSMAGMCFFTVAISVDVVLRWPQRPTLGYVLGGAIAVALQSSVIFLTLILPAWALRSGISNGIHSHLICIRTCTPWLSCANPSCK
ncbi:MAG: hypothetical protein JW910_09445 [Anaerolineae bacterium]|nr:hypothetical protein [Anaerolineae bacterium]